MDEAVRLLVAADVTLVITHQAHVILQIRGAIRQQVRILIHAHVRLVRQNHSTEAATRTTEEVIHVRRRQEVQVLIPAQRPRVSQLTPGLLHVLIRRLRREVQLTEVTQHRAEVAHRKVEVTLLLHEVAVIVLQLIQHLHGQAARVQAQGQVAGVRLRVLQEGHGDKLNSIVQSTLFSGMYFR